MKISATRAAAIAFFLSLTLGSSAQAALVEWTFSAAVQDIDGNVDGVADFGITSGTILSATFLLDNTADGQLISNNVWYYNSVVDIALSAGDFQAVLDPAAPTEFNTVLVRDQEVDAVATSAAILVSNGSENLEAFLALQFIGSDGQLVSNTLFPSIPDFEHVDPYNGPAFGGTFFSLQLTVDGVFTTVVAEIFGPQARVVPVPVPGALLLMGSALLALFGASRRA